MRSGTAALLSSSLWICAAGCTDNPTASNGANQGLDDAAAGRSGGTTATAADAGPAQLARASRFPGSGTGPAGAALPNGDVCDAVVSKQNIHVVTPATKCLKAHSSDYLAATLEQVLECADGQDTIHLRLTFDPGFVDNTFGSGSIGWPRRRGHTMDKDLVRSDHAEISASDASGTPVVRFKLDYISRDPSQPSGWGSLGVRGGDGAMLTGDPAWIVRWNTSLSRNFNERGYAQYTVDSPATDEDYTPNPETPEWDYRVVYEAWVDAAAFGDAGFGDASISFVHASPSKAREDTLHVEPGDCPPPFCQPDDPRCAGTGGWGGSSADCQPDDPECVGTGGVGGSASDCGPDDPGCVGTGGIGGTGGNGTDCGPDDPACTGQGGIGGTGGNGTDCGPDDPACTGQGGIGGTGGNGTDCGPDDPACTGQGGIGGTGGSSSDCAPDDPECFGIGTVAGAPSTPSEEPCPPDQPGCSPD